ncbi:hypothetical protein ACIBO2_12720 [Nonomuraea sp. NPDC050022]|uniref:hypothetical protein n=1 Tax=Nonomuraea sp. NPDC050022 TaxID=3364358 RepID=UPI0037887F23
MDPQGIARSNAFQCDLNVVERVPLTYPATESAYQDWVARNAKFSQNCHERTRPGVPPRGHHERHPAPALAVDPAGPARLAVWDMQNRRLLLVTCVESTCSASAVGQSSTTPAQSSSPSTHAADP